MADLLDELTIDPTGIRDAALESREEDREHNKDRSTRTLADPLSHSLLFSMECEFCKGKSGEETRCFLMRLRWQYYWVCWSCSQQMDGWFVT